MRNYIFLRNTALVVAHLFASASLASEQSFIEAKVCDWHAYTHVGVAERDGLSHYYPDLAPHNPDRLAKMAKGGGALALVAAGISLWHFGPSATFRGVLGVFLAALAGGLTVKIGARIAEVPQHVYDTLPAENCRVLIRHVTAEQARAALAFVEQAKGNAGFNIFHSSCIDFSQRIFDAAGQDFRLLQEAAKIKPFDFSYMTSSWMNVLLMIEGVNNEAFL
jgi:hypothetical protein